MCFWNLIKISANASQSLGSLLPHSTLPSKNKQTTTKNNQLTAEYLFNANYKSWSRVISSCAQSAAAWSLQCLLKEADALESHPNINAPPYSLFFSFPKRAILYIIFAIADRNIRENAEGRGALWPVIKNNPEQQMCVHAKPPTFMNGLCCGQKRVFSLLAYPPQSTQKSHNRIGSANSVRHNPSNFIIPIASQELHSLNPSYSNPI